MQPIRILLVEDEPTFVFAVKAALKSKSKFKFEIESVGWLEQAIERLYESDIDVVLLDLSLPDSQGLETVVRVRQLCSVTPVIVLTGREDDIALEALKVGAQDYLLKGNLDGEVLWRAIRYAIERSKLIEQREEFMGTLTHDLKNPLIATTRILELMADGAIGEVTREQAKLLRNLHHANTHLLWMVQNLLDVYRLDKDLNALVFTHGNLLQLVNNCIDEMRPLADGKKVEFELDLRPLTKDYSADLEHMRRVVRNLLDNALKFTPEGGKISVRLFEQPEDVCLEITDTGPGISSEEQKLLFQRFGRGSSSRAHRASTGLGLYVCKQIVEMHGGTISCHSEKGTTFCIHLPVEPPVALQHA